jgi:hypothetical protein
LDATGFPLDATGFPPPHADAIIAAASAAESLVRLRVLPMFATFSK